MKQLIVDELKRYALESGENWLEDIRDHYYDEPLIQFASADDPIFEEYKRIIGETHLTPKEVYEAVFGEGSYHGGTVISVVLPVTEKIRKSNREQTVWPSKEWARLRAFGDDLFRNNFMRHIVGFLDQMGYKAVAPTLTEGYKTYRGKSGPESNWSERHTAYAAGLGTFSINDAFITEKGIAIRLLSVITELKVEPDGRSAVIHTENCLFCSKGTCGACMSRCPVGAITKDGHDKMKCYQYAYGDESKKLAESYGGSAKAGAGCGLCLTKVPCEFRKPAAGSMGL